MDFGTGALKVTPGHEMNDYQLGQKHKLEVVDVLNEDGTLSVDAQLYIGEDRFEARKKILKALEEKGLLLKIEDYTNQLGFSERSDAVVEPRLSLQWWVTMKPLATPALKAVMEEQIKFYPSKFKNLYRNWMENIRDWCISRQLWWGQRIPAWYDDQGNYIVAATEEEALLKYEYKFGQSPVQGLKQDEDVLDTWFSSWLWPIEVFRGISEPGNNDIKYYYPTNTLVTAPEIIFFWVARMIMAGYEYMKEKPFSDVYFTGIVRDKLGRKMSKQLGNSPDLLALIDHYGADAVRFGILISSPAGNDLLFDEASLDQGRNFNNKLWNAMKLVKSWEGKSEVGSQKSEGRSQNGEKKFAVEWFANRLNEARIEIEQLFSDFRLSEALKTSYSLIWDDFCSWYLEWIKPAFAEASADKPGSKQQVEKEVYEKTVDFFEQLMQLLHPFMPFITEEIYHLLKERKKGDDLVVKQSSKNESFNETILSEVELLKNVITAIRDFRIKNGLKSKEAIKVYVESDDKNKYDKFWDILQKQLVIATWQDAVHKPSNAATIVIGKDKFYIASENIKIDNENLRNELNKELQHLQNFLNSVEKKLTNERFISNAKQEIVNLEKKKKADAEAKIRAIEESLSTLG